MRIAYIHTAVLPSPSPSVTFSTMNAVGLAKAFDHCYFFCLKTHSSSTASDIMLTHFGMRQPSNMTIHHMRPGFMKFLHFPRIYRRLKKLLKAKKVDVLITRTVGFLPYLAALRSKYGVPAYYEAHDLFADLDARGDIDRNKKRRHEGYERKYIPELSGIICLQNTQKEWYQKSFPDTNIHVARTGITKVHHYPYDNRRFLAYVGSFQPHKGVETLIKALARTKSAPELLIVGGKNESEMTEMRELVRENYDPSKVTITGWVNKSDLAGFLSLTAIGVVPLIDTFFNRLLTSPLKLFDFLAFGIPVIASDLPTTRELVIENETGVFFRPGDPDDLARKIDALLVDREVLKTMSGHVYDRAGRYLWEDRARQIRSIVENDGASPRDGQP